MIPEAPGDRLLVSDRGMAHRVGDDGLADPGCTGHRTVAWQPIDGRDLADALAAGVVGLCHRPACFPGTGPVRPIRRYDPAWRRQSPRDLVRHQLVAAGLVAEPLGSWGLLVIGQDRMAVVGIAGGRQHRLSDVVAGRLTTVARLTAGLPVEVTSAAPKTVGAVITTMQTPVRRA